MSIYLLIKWLYIVSSVVLVGVGFGSAFYMFFINKTREPRIIHEVTRIVIKADYWFTTPAIIIQPITGVTLAYLGGYDLNEQWLLLTYALFILAGLCWLPVVWLQIKMAKMARFACEQNKQLNKRYWLYFRYWTMLGALAFPMMLAVFALMIIKPDF